ncbi:MAG: hypothetical protein MJ247_05550 [Alphaproteobacteria bacterium]|nr:hypothetical protein [Alphaproteobacteria bacterium]
MITNLKKLFFTIGMMLSPFVLSNCIALYDQGFNSTTDLSNFGRGCNAFEHGDYEAALKLFFKDTEANNPDAHYMIGMIYLYGLANEKNTYVAQKYLTSAAMQGHEAAQEILAYMYASPRMELYNTLQAYYWFKALERSHPYKYRQEIKDLYAQIYSKGQISKANALELPKITQFKGINYNAMFPYR